LGERLNGIQEVGGSIPLSSTSTKFDNDVASESDFVLSGTRVNRSVSASVIDRENLVFNCAFAACIVSGLALIWRHRFLPISDYPDWLFEGEIVSELFQGQSFPSYTFSHYPIPNSGVVVLLGLLDCVFSPEVSGKIVLSLSIILFLFSSTYLLTSLARDRHNPLVLIPLLFVCNTYFFWGEISYVFALSIFFFYCAYLFRRIDRSKPYSWPLISALLIAIFFFHFLPYAAAVLVSLIFLIAESQMDALRSAALSLAPSLGLTIWYVLERLSQTGAGPGWTFWTLHRLAGRWIAAFSPFPEFMPWVAAQSPGMTAAALLNLLVTGLLTLVVPACLLFWTNGHSRNRGVLAAAVGCLVAVIASGYAVSGLTSPGERFLYPAIWIGMCWLIGESLPHKGSFVNRSLTLLSVLLIAGQIVFLQINVAKASNGLAVLYDELRAAKSHAEFCDTYESYIRESWDKPHRRGFDLLLTNHASAPRLPYYLCLERNEDAPIFATSILNYSGDRKAFCELQ
jgi:hypothetical protein